MQRAGTLGLAGLMGLLTAMGPCAPPPLERARVDQPGFVEPHTPGSGAAEEATPSERLLRLLGPDPDLNVVTTSRTRAARPGPKPRAILIVVPGFLSGASPYDPLARQLVTRLDGALEVWAVDRRPNQLEDLRGLRHAAQGTLESVGEAVRFYFPGSDLDENGVPDPAFELPDALGAPSSFLRLARDDVRFLAHWGVDTQVRDWKLLVEEARRRVGPKGLVLFGGHSLGTVWAGLFAAYDFDPGPGVEGGHEKIDGLLLLEGGGPGAPSPDAPTRSEYLARVQELAMQGGPAVFEERILGAVPVVDLGAAATVAGLLGLRDPSAPSPVQLTPFGALLRLLIQARATNRAIVGFFLDDDFSPSPAFRASMGFSDDGINTFLSTLDVYVPVDDGSLRDWSNFDEDLPSCPPNSVDVSPGCAVSSNGPKPASGASPRVWGFEREVTDIDEILRLISSEPDFVEWYFVGPRASLDFEFGRDARRLGDESLLAVTRNAHVDVPVLAIGGSNGLTPTEASFEDYLGSIATPPADREIVILEGYAHVDPLTAAANEAVEPIAVWIERLLARARNQADSDSDSDSDGDFDSDSDSDSDSDRRRRSSGKRKRAGP